MKKIVIVGTLILLSSYGVYRLVRTEPPKQLYSASVSHEPGLAGIYCTPYEVAGFAGAFLELNGDKFRYWSYSDVGPPFHKEPIAGHYSFEDGKVTLQSKEIYDPNYFADVINGVPVLWATSGLKVWCEQKKIYDYAVLIKTDAKSRH